MNLQDLSLFNGIDSRYKAMWIKTIHEKYSEPHRHYHTLEHIINMLSVWSNAMVGSLSDLSRDKYNAFLLAIVFHDIEYNTIWSSNNENEELSVLWMKKFANPLFPKGVIEYAEKLIMATKYHQLFDNKPASAIFIDSDMSILGESDEIYTKYCKDVRNEWNHIDDNTFNRGRKNFIVDLLESPRIYFSDILFEKYEIKARENLRRELITLST